MPRIRLAAMVVAALALAACGKDATSPNSMKSTEAQSLALMMAAGADAYAGAAPTANVVTLGTARAATQTVNITYQASLPCPKGGTVEPNATVTGTADPVVHSASLHLDGSEKRTDCAYQVQANTITVNGTLTITAEVNVVAGLPSGKQSFTEKGTILWASSDGRSGSCDIDLNASADFGNTTVQRTVDAQFCGRTLHFTSTI